MPFTAQCIVLVFLSAGLVEAYHSSVNEVSRSNQDFATALYSELAKEDNSSNIFFSPLSIHVILALAYVGAGGQTAREMAAGLRLLDDVDVVKTGFQQLLQDMKDDTDSVVLEIANKMYLPKNCSVKSGFNIAATKNFFSEVENVDFCLGAETVRIINEWVKNKTHDKIKDLISAVNPLTKSILVNAVYFKGRWKHVFDKKETQTREFRVTSNKTKKVEMMYKSAHFVFVKNDDIGADILQLDYEGYSMSLVIMLPFEVEGLSELENRISGANLTALLRHYRKVEVYLPKFKLEQTLQLNKYLKALGMTNMFESNADFSPMSDSSSYVSEVLHKAFIDVNEESTEAAAVAGRRGRGRGRSKQREQPPITFSADHPFVFILRCKTSGAVVFMGRYADPE